MGKSYYKFLKVDGFRDIVKNGRLKFSNMNAWKNNANSGDPFENYFSRCFEEKEAFDNFLKVCKDYGDNEQQILLKLGYLHILSYRTYALSLTKVSNKDCMAMWNGYARTGVRIEFSESLFDYLKEQNRAAYSMVTQDVKYRARMRKLKYVFGREFEKEIFRTVAFFEKINAYAYEKEFRVIASEFGVENALQLMFIPFAKEFELDFDQLQQSIDRYYPSYRTTEKDEIYLVGDYLPYIKSVQASPYISRTKEKEIGKICSKFALNYQGVSKIKSFQFKM